MNARALLRGLGRRARLLVGRSEDDVIATLCGTPAERQALDAAMKLPDRAWRRMDRLDRARVRAGLARILASVGERALLAADVSLWSQAFLEGWRTDTAFLPVLFAAGPVGGRATFLVARVDLDRGRAETPPAMDDFLAALEAWSVAPEPVRGELAHEMVVCAVALGDAAAARRRTRSDEADRVHALRDALLGRSPAAATDGEAATALCRAYVTGILRTGDETPFERPVEGSSEHV